MKRLILALFLTASASFAQDARGLIAGRVLDPRNAPVPGASVDAVAASTGVKIVASRTTGSMGLFYREIAFDKWHYHRLFSRPDFA